MIITCVGGGSSRANIKFGGKPAMSGLFPQLSASPNIPPAIRRSKMIIIYLFLFVRFV